MIKWILLMMATTLHSQHFEKATFAGGCFWCMEQPFDVLEGVISTTSGYIGGHIKNPTYEDVCKGTTGHTEAVEVLFDPQKVSYETLLKTFWMNINPVQKDGQFYDRGTQYRTGIFFHSEAQKQKAEDSKKELATSGKFDSPIVTEITKATMFYKAEEYHQNYYQTNPWRYNMYKKGSGRSEYIEKTWGEKNE